MRSNTKQGFTLLELMVVMAIVAILAAIAYPSMSDSLARRQIDAHFHDVIASLKAAKSYALDDKRFDYVVVCASNSGDACDSNDWNEGWIAFGDANASGDFDPASETAFIQQDKVGSRSQVAVVNFNSGAQVNKFIINQDGFTADNLYSCGNAGPPAYFFRICPKPTTTGASSFGGRAVIYTPSGAIRLSRDTDADGIQNVGANNINCG